MHTVDFKSQLGHQHGRIAIGVKDQDVDAKSVEFFIYIQVEGQ